MIANYKIIIFKQGPFVQSFRFSGDRIRSDSRRSELTSCRDISGLTDQPLKASAPLGHPKATSRSQTLLQIWAPKKNYAVIPKVT